MFSEELEKIDWEETTKTIYSKTESDVPVSYTHLTLPTKA